MIILAIFSMVGVLVIAAPLHQFNLVYDEIVTYEWGYWGLSIVLMIFLHDTYFYWMHHLMHHPKLFNYFHLVYHKSTNPSPLGSLCFSSFGSGDRSFHYLSHCLVDSLSPNCLARFFDFYDYLQRIWAFGL